MSRYLLVLARRGSVKSRGIEYLNPASDERLRELLAEWADRAAAPYQVRNYCEWRLDVYRVDSRVPDNRGVRVASVAVDDAGRTVVRR